MVKNSLFVFGENAKKENTYLYVSKNPLDIKKFDRNDYIYKPSKVLIYNKQLQDYLELLDDGKVTQQDYNNILRTNQVNDDMLLVREVTTFEKDGNTFSIAKGDSFDEFFLGDNYTNLVYDFSNLKNIELDTLDKTYFVDSLIRLGYFTTILNVYLGQDYDDFNFLGVQEDENGNKYFVLNNREKNLIVSEKFVKDTLDLYLDFSLDDTLNSLENKGKTLNEGQVVSSKDINQKQIEEKRNLLQRFMNLKDEKKYVNNDELLDIIQIVDIVENMATNPMIGAIRFGGLMLYKVKIEPYLEENSLEGQGIKYLVRLSDGILGKVNESVLESFFSKETINNLVKEANKSIVKEDVFKQIPIEVEREDPNKEKENKNGLEL